MKALAWLKYQERIATTNNLDRRDKLRALVRISYYRGEILFRQEHYIGPPEKDAVVAAQQRWLIASL
jgi:hypothetical protein